MGGHLPRKSRCCQEIKEQINLQYFYGGIIMRNITIKREEINDGSFYTANIYIEDILCGDTEIGGVRCRCLGQLKNGEEATFSVECAEQKLFAVLAEVRNIEQYNCIILPFGYDNIYLTAKYSKGNLIFNGMQNNPVAPKKGGFWKALGENLLGRIIAVVVIAVVFGLIASVKESGIFAKDKDFTVGDFSITLTNDFEQEPFDEWYAYFFSDYAEVYANRFPLVDSDYDISDWTVEDYMAIVEYSGYMGESYTKHAANGISYYEFDFYSDQNQNCANYLFVFKGSDAFWEVEFLCLDEKGDKFEDRFIEWAQSVSVK